MNHFDVLLLSPIDEIQRVPRHILSSALKAARSLRPGADVIEAAAAGNEEACVVRDAWRFNHPIRLVTPDEFECICERGRTTFEANGR